MLVTTGVLRVVTSADGSTLITSDSTAAPTITDQKGLWIRATVDVNNGAAGNTVTFYTSNDAQTTDPERVTWSQLGNPVVNAGTTSIFNSTAGLNIGATDTGTLNRFTGKIYQARIYNGLNRSVAANFNPNLTCVRNQGFAVRNDGALYVNSAAATTTTFNGLALVSGRLHETGL